MTDTEPQKERDRNGGRYEHLKWWAIAAAVAVFSGFAGMVFKAFEKQDEWNREFSRQLNESNREFNRQLIDQARNRTRINKDTFD